MEMQFLHKTLTRRMKRNMKKNQPMVNRKNSNQQAINRLMNAKKEIIVRKVLPYQLEITIVINRMKPTLYLLGVLVIICKNKHLMGVI